MTARTYHSPEECVVVIHALGGVNNRHANRWCEVSAMTFRTTRVGFGGG
jgi:hypothetical protein